MAPLTLNIFRLAKRFSMLALCFCATFGFSSLVHGQSFNLVDNLGGILSLEGFSATGIGDASGNFLATRPVSQIAFAPGVNDKVYVATARDGIFRFDYDPTSPNPLTNQVLAVASSISSSGAVVADTDGSLGLAFHQDSNGVTSAYLAPATGFRGNRDFDDPNENFGIVMQSIVRVSDIDGDGLFGVDISGNASASDQSVAIVNNIRVTTLHQINQIEIVGDSLFVGIGSATNTGGAGAEDFPGESQYSGTISYIPDLNAVPSTLNAAGFTLFDVNGDGNINDIDARTDTQAFNALPPANRLSVYSTGLRNVFGVEVDDNGVIYTSENEFQDGPEDSLIETFFQSDHGFEKENDLVDFRADTALQNEGFFQAAGGTAAFPNFLDPFSIDIDRSSSPGGMAFLQADAGAFAGSALVSRFVPSDILLVDVDSGDQFTIVNNVDRTLDIERDPFGNFLITDAGGNIQILAVNGVSGPLNPIEPNDGMIADPAADYVASLSAINAEPTAFPSGWTYLFSDAASGGTETDLTVIAGLANGGNTGFGVIDVAFEVPGVLGNVNLGDEFEVFGDGFSGNGGLIPTGNEGVVGEDLLLVPGFGTDDQFIIARYTISAADLADSVAGTGSIVGSFRDLVFRQPANSNHQGSVDVFVFHNGNPVFSVDRDNVPATAGRLTQADGTFNITGLSFAAGDTISFVVGNNGNIGGDESALQAAISVDSDGSTALAGDFDGNGAVECADLDGFINNIDQPASGDLVALDIDGNGTITDSDADTVIRMLVQTSNGRVGTFPGDFNCDGTVDVLNDAFALVANLNDSVTSYAQGDVDFDGEVTVLGDAFVLVANLNNTNEP
ncbi:hypothetical protein N9L06_02355 [Mariniblastus sp.]|nr:hypothetical protein [Mariniblastus sp.]